MKKKLLSVVLTLALIVSAIGVVPAVVSSAEQPAGYILSKYTGEEGDPQIFKATDGAFVNAGSDTVTDTISSVSYTDDYEIDFRIYTVNWGKVEATVEVDGFTVWVRQSCRTDDMGQKVNATITYGGDTVASITDAPLGASDWVGINYKFINSNGAVSFQANRAGVGDYTSNVIGSCSGTAAGYSATESGSITVSFKDLRGSSKNDVNINLSNLYVYANEPACAHANTHEVAAVAATCTTDGYTAGVYCDDCGEYISGHELIPAAHGATEVRNAVAATATVDGYTGDTYCTVCNTLLSSGTVIPAEGNIVTLVPVTYTSDSGPFLALPDGVSSVRIGQYIKLPSYIYIDENGSKAYLRNFRTCGTSWFDWGKSTQYDKSATVTLTGDYISIWGLDAWYDNAGNGNYTGELASKWNWTDKKLFETSIAPAPSCEHENTHEVAAVAPTCTTNGYTAGVYCDDCGEYISGHEVIPAAHGATEIRNAVAATCTVDGYTGDTYCTVCNEKLADGEVIPAAHGATEIRDAVAATCTTNGYTGDTYCTVCNEKIADGEAIPASHGEAIIVGELPPTPTRKGYTGDQYCSICGAKITNGSSIREAKTYENEMFDSANILNITQGSNTDMENPVKLTDTIENINFTNSYQVKFRVNFSNGKTYSTMVFDNYTLYIRVEPYNAMFFNLKYNDGVNGDQTLVDTSKNAYNNSAFVTGWTGRNFVFTNWDGKVRLEMNTKGDGNYTDNLMDVFEYDVANKKVGGESLVYTPVIDGDLDYTLKVDPFSNLGSSGSVNNIYVDKEIDPYPDPTTAEQLVPTGHSLTLDGNIGINFYFVMSDAVRAGINSVSFALPDGETATGTLALVDAGDESEFKQYKVSCYVTSTQMMGIVTGRLLDSGSNQVGETFEYQVTDYATNAMSNSSLSTDLKDLTKAMINYGGYAQSYFGRDYNTNNIVLANEPLSSSDKSLASVVTPTGHEKTITGTLPDGLTYLGSTLLLESSVTVRHYFRVAEGHDISDYTFNYGVEVLTPGSKDVPVRYYVEIENIAVAEFDEDKVLTVGDWSISYGVFTYIQSKLNNESTPDALKNLLKSMVIYNEKANTFFES